MHAPYIFSMQVSYAGVVCKWSIQAHYTGVVFRCILQVRYAGEDLPEGVVNSEVEEEFLH